MTIEIKSKELNSLIDSVNGAAWRLAHAMSAPVMTRDAQDEMALASAAVNDRVAELVKRLGVYSQTAGQSLVSQWSEYVFTMARMSASGEVKALSGSGFRKKVKEQVLARYDIEVVSPETPKKAKTERVSADELAAFRAWKAQQA